MPLSRHDLGAADRGAPVVSGSAHALAGWLTGRSDGSELACDGSPTPPAQLVKGENSMEMAYSGHVEPGGPAAIRELPHVTISKLSVGTMDNNTYLVVCRKTGDATLIDAANDNERILDLLGDGPGRPRLRSIVTTHRHRDHWEALPAVAGMTGANLYAGAADADALPVPTDVPLEQGSVVPLGDCELEVIALRGHTEGSVALLYRDPEGSAHLFSGDSLFPGGPGKTGSAQDFASLMDDLQRRVFDILPDDTWVYPGHGDDTTLGAERPHLTEWRTRGW